MGSYELHAWRDAMALADFLREECEAMDLTVAAARRIYESIDVNNLIDYEEQVSDAVATMIQKPEGQRANHFRKTMKDATTTTKVGFLVLCILGAVRAKEVLELRDRFRMVLAPGSGNRVTCAGAYAFAAEVVSSFNYARPEEVFGAMGIDDSDD
jgi:hypothetical protein